MTLPRFRRRADDDQDATEHLQAIRPADWDGTTITWTGAGGGAMDSAVIYDNSYDATGWEPDVAAGLRQDIEFTALAERGPGPGTGRARLRAMPPAPQAPAAQPAPQPAPPVRHDDDTMARGMARGWPHLFEVRCAHPAAQVATPIPCGAVHRDATATSFRGLRQSAWNAGWHLDALGRWTCPDCCQASPGYRTLYPLTVWDPDAAEARLARDPDAEFAYRAAAEHDLFRSVRDATRHGRHAGGAR